MLEKAKASQIKLEKMVTTRFEGWKIKFNDQPCGFIKFYPKNDDFFLCHATLYILIPKPYRGMHIGRIALEKAIKVSQYTHFVAHVRKGNFSSKKLLSAAGFKDVKNYPTNQICMVYQR